MVGGLTDNLKVPYHGILFYPLGLKIFVGFQDFYQLSDFVDAFLDMPKPEKVFVNFHR
jgi:hypothetical protein